MITEIQQPNSLYLKWINDDKGWGVFTNSLIKKNDTVEICYCILDNYETSPLRDYIFASFDTTTDVCHALGYGAIYNHSFEPNIVWKLLYKDRYILIEFTALRDIEIGEELVHSYGEDYWRIRSHKKLI